jgi:hypothetical protein
MQFRIKDVTYNGAALDQLSLKDILLLEKGTAELGRPLKWGEIEQWTTELDRLVAIQADETRTALVREKAAKEHQDHPGAMWVMALVIWASRRLAGESISFEEAISFPVRDLQWVAEPANRASRRAANPTKARPATPKGSGRAASQRPAAAATKASKSRSTAD